VHDLNQFYPFSFLFFSFLFFSFLFFSSFFVFEIYFCLMKKKNVAIILSIFAFWQKEGKKKKPSLFFALHPQ